jgi:hypothetical protein
MTIRRILIRRDTAANWTAANPTLASGELGGETDTGKLKLGNGSTAWNSLAYQGSVTSVNGSTGAVTGLATLASPTFTGTVTIPSGASISGFATLASPTFTGTVTLPNSTVTAAMIASDAVTQAKIADRAVGSAELTNLTLNAQTGTTYTLTLTDAQKLVTLSNASGITLTVPTNATVAFTIGDQVNLMQLGAGQVTVAASAGVTVSSQGAKLKLNGQYATGTLVKVATDSWVFIGNLAA